MNLSLSSCWIVAEDLAGLQNQAIGLAQALGVAYTLTKLDKPKNIWQKMLPPRHDLKAPWPDLLISCGQRSARVSLYVRKASQGKTFTVHIQNPNINPKAFDVIIAPAHDHLTGSNVFVHTGAIHHVTKEKLESAAGHFRPLLYNLPRPVISVLLGGNNRHQQFSQSLALDLGYKLQTAARAGSLAITPSRRSGQENVEILKQHLATVPHYIWDGQGENPYFGLLALADAIVVTSDSVSMISEACFTGKPVYVYELPGGGRRHREFLEKLKKEGLVRPFLGTIENWANTPLDETKEAADFVCQAYSVKAGLL